MIRIPNWEDVFSGLWNIILYTITIISYIVIIYYKAFPFFWLIIALFAIWDLSYVCFDRSLGGRDHKLILDQITHARTVVSYFLAFQAVIVGSLVAQKDIAAVFNNAISTSGVPKYMFIFPIFVSAIIMLFIPINVKEHITNNEHTLSLRALFGAIMFGEKVVIYSTSVIWISLVFHKWL